MLPFACLFSCICICWLLVLRIVVLLAAASVSRGGVDRGGGDADNARVGLLAIADETKHVRCVHSQTIAAVIILMRILGSTCPTPHPKQAIRRLKVRHYSTPGVYGPPHGQGAVDPGS